MDITPTDFLKQATSTAEHFGFKNLGSYKKDPQLKGCNQKLTNSSSAVERRLDSLHGMLTAGISAYTDEKLHAIDGPVFYYSVDQVPRSGEAAVSLQIFGVEKSIAEAILIQAARSLADDLGFSNTSVRINSMGDRDSSTRYHRELTNYLKKRMEDMPISARELMKEHTSVALMHLLEKGHELGFKSPSPLEYLSDQSRKHFREIIEYLDISETPYEIDPKLIGHYQCYSDALFAVDLLDDDHRPLEQEPIFIRGGRYSNFMFKHARKEIPAVGAVIVLREKKAPLRTPRVPRQNPSVYVVQLGFGPKIRSLMLVDNFKRANIPVMQSLSSDSLSAQLRDAENQGVRYTIIIGQKEFVENTVILRDMQARNQESVPLETITSRLKRTKAVA